MIKVEGFNAEDTCEDDDGNIYCEVQINPHLALKALEEQAPDELNEWARNNDLVKFYLVEKNVYTPVPPSPWIKVSDQSPPKDGKTFIVMDSWGECSSVAWNHGQKAWEGFESRYFNKFSEGTKWMPIPE